MRCDGSSIISFHWLTQPTVRATANSAVNICVGMPIAFRMMPELDFAAVVAEDG
jgi:hypothetical protein